MVVLTMNAGYKVEWVRTSLRQVLIFFKTFFICFRMLWWKGVYPFSTLLLFSIFVIFDFLNNSDLIHVLFFIESVSRKTFKNLVTYKFMQSTFWIFKHLTRLTILKKFDGTLFTFRVMNILKKLIYTNMYLFQ